MFLPASIQHLQHDLLLEAPHQFGTGDRDLLFVGLAMHGLETLAELLLMEALVVLVPFHHGRIEVELVLEMRLEPRQIPLLRQALGGTKLVMASSSTSSRIPRTFSETSSAPRMSLRCS